MRLHAPMLCALILKKSQCVLWVGSIHGDGGWNGGGWGLSRCTRYVGRWGGRDWSCGVYNFLTVVTIRCWISRVMEWVEETWRETRIQTDRHSCMHTDVYTYLIISMQYRPTSIMASLRLPLELRLPSIGRFPTHSIIVLKLFLLTVLESGAPLSNRGLKSAIKVIEWMNEYRQTWKQTSRHMNTQTNI